MDYVSNMKNNYIFHRFLFIDNEHGYKKSHPVISSTSSWYR